MDPISILQIAVGVWKTGGTIVHFISAFREELNKTRPETPEETAAFNGEIEAMDQRPAGKPEDAP